LNTKEYLSRAFDLNKLIISKQSQIQHLRDLQADVSNTLNPFKVQTSPNNDRLGDITADILDLIESYTNDIKKLLTMKRKIKAIIDGEKIESYRCLLSFRYESFLAWEEIAEKMNYNERYIYKLHRRAIKDIERQSVGVIQ
jgi:hypothetical protein